MAASTRGGCTQTDAVGSSTAFAAPSPCFEQPEAAATRVAAKTTVAVIRRFILRLNDIWLTAKPPENLLPRAPPV
ncbi:hypothetical protein GCM10017620_15160 [Brevundimonas intermedia]|uniref:Uncharacterized protein n=1 Tax=Brevundimonas intermedia TaxID=74315 RepID=A0ABQ5T815_9CAUL|nr:hypothetical protein GCM10017620_15160 [Brevundimonas intermedia]